MSKTKLSDSLIVKTIAKLPDWVTIAVKNQEQLSIATMNDTLGGTAFIDKVPGLRDELVKGGIQPDEFFPALEKILQGHNHFRTAQMFQAQKADYELQKQEWNKMLEDPNVPAEQKQMISATIENSERQIKTLSRTPLGFSNDEYELIKVHVDRIDTVLAQIQEQSRKQYEADSIKAAKEAQKKK
jgi:hypothetical protein